MNYLKRLGWESNKEKNIVEFVDNHLLIKTQYKHYNCLFARIYVKPNIIDKVINNSAVKFVDNQLLIIT